MWSTTCCAGWRRPKQATGAEAVSSTSPHRFHAGLYRVIRALVEGLCRVFFAVTVDGMNINRMITIGRPSARRMRGSPICWRV